VSQKNHFDTNWQKNITRFRILVGLKSLSINLKHPQTSKPAKPHEALPEVFTQWQQIQTPWDQQRLIFETIYELIGQHLKPWQFANFLNLNRQPIEAIDLLHETINSDLEPENYTQSCASLAQTLFNLTYYEDTLDWAKRAYNSDPNNLRFQITLADCFLLNNMDEEAVTIYQYLMNKSDTTEDDSISKIFSDLFARETGVVPSPVWAVEFAKQLKNTKQAAEFWRLGESEFYDNHYFRAHHAYYLADIGELERSFAKLTALVQEMHWLKEASLNLLRYFEYFNSNGNKIMPEFQAQLQQQIKEKNWTTEGMEKREARR